MSIIKQDYGEVGGDKISNIVYVNGDVYAVTTAAAGWQSAGTLLDLDKYKKLKKIKATIAYSNGTNLGTPTICACDGEDYSGITAKTNLPFGTEVDITSLLNSDKKFLKIDTYFAAVSTAHYYSTIKFEFS